MKQENLKKKTIKHSSMSEVDLFTAKQQSRKHLEVVIVRFKVALKLKSASNKHFQIFNGKKYEPTLLYKHCKRKLRRAQARFTAIWGEDQVIHAAQG